jgi:membrane-associated protein
MSFCVIDSRANLRPRARLPARHHHGQPGHVPGAGIVFIDDWVWFAPGDTAMITAGIIAANGGLLLYLVIIAGAVGGLFGDNVFYFLGRRFGPRLADRLLKSDRAQERYRWARRQIETRGSTILIVGRFIPAGRTITTFACGTSRLAYRHFLLADSAAAFAWADIRPCLASSGEALFAMPFGSRC